MFEKIGSKFEEFGWNDGSMEPSEVVTLRAVARGEFDTPREPDSPFDDFGPIAGYSELPSAKLDRDGALTVQASGVGAVGLVTWHWRAWGPTRGSGCVMIGAWIMEAHRGKGFGAAAHRKLIDLLFQHTTTNRIEAHTDVDNHVERNLLIRVGLVEEGITRGAQWRRGRYRDGVLFAILRSDWRP